LSWASTRLYSTRTHSLIAWVVVARFMQDANDLAERGPRAPEEAFAAATATTVAATSSISKREPIDCLHFWVSGRLSGLVDA